MGSAITQPRLSKRPCFAYVLRALAATPWPDRAADVTIFAVITEEPSQVGYLTEEDYFFSADYTFGFAGFS